MRIDGQWYLCDDEIVRPIVSGEILTGDGSWLKVLFLVDIGADVTALSADVLRVLGLPTRERPDRLGGVGGIAGSVALSTQIRLLCDDGGKAVFRGEFSAFTSPEALDMSVLGRDILDLFAVIADRQGTVVALIRDRHRYRIVSS
jgi:hypothetical protein